ncbi:MAG TPA: GNAT family N-acetyltransferase [Candidatus Latescibacteria bacterium]|nr:GNAT family N-acetyltransferase [Candidatus Latescibacterota bacterium]
MRHPGLYIRPLEPRDIVPVARLLDESLPHDRVTPRWLKEKAFADSDYDSALTLCAIDGGNLVGFAHGVARPLHAPVRGWFKWFAVAAHRRRTGIASRLFDRIERVMARRGVRSVSIADSVPNYTMPGVDPRYLEARAFLAQRGYAEGEERVNMTCPLTTSDWETGDQEDRLVAQGIRIIRAGRTDLSRALQFTRTWFPSWTPEVAHCFLREPISLHLAVEDACVIGFAAYDANNPGMAWFGPMGTHPEKRARGVGSVLLKRCLRDLAAQGHAEAIIPWVGPVAFYEKACGAAISRTFMSVSKQLMAERG